MQEIAYPILRSTQSFISKIAPIISHISDGVDIKPLVTRILGNANSFDKRKEPSTEELETMMHTNLHEMQDVTWK